MTMNEDITQHPLWQTQVELEEEMRALGVQAFQRQLQEALEEGQGSRVPAARRIMLEMHQKVLNGIISWVTEMQGNPGAAARAKAYRVLTDCDLDLAAHIALRGVLDSISTRSTLTHAAGLVGMLLEDEMHFRAYQEQDERRFNFAQARAQRSPSYSFRRQHLKAKARNHGVKFDEWSQADRVIVGGRLIEIVIATTGIARVVTLTVGEKSTKTVIEATPETADWMEREHRNLEALSPTYLPTVIPPRDWTSPFEGGYWTKRVRRLTLVKTRKRSQLRPFENHEMPEVYAAINAVQRTPWRINRPVLNTMMDLYERGITLDIIPSPDKIEKPQLPVWIVEGMTEKDMTPEQVEEFRAWKRSAANVYEQNARMTMRRITFMRKLWVASKFEHFESIYFPHTLDFRGRMYPVPLHLHPQGDDVCRALLQFSEGQPIETEEAVMWLAAHLAGCFGVDKVSFEDRLAWVRSHEQDIIASAEDPMSCVWWATAEKPWCALAACIDWAGYLQQGLGYVSHLPVQMDGSCNGLQHFSAMLRDPVGGSAVNLVPSDKPSDIYSAVAEVVARRVERDAMDGNEEAKGWLGRVNRKVCKRPVMTLAYGAKQYGFSQMVFDDTITPWFNEKKGDFPFAGNGWSAACYMGKVIWESVGDVVVAARNAMEWLQKVAKACSDAEAPITWVTPAGFLGRQEYIKPNMMRIDLTFNKVMYRISIDSAQDQKDREQEKLDKLKQVNGISPNFVHSMDAAHLMKTIIASVNHGITAFSLIHDSYGTHARNAPLMARLLREEFFLMYADHDVLFELAQRVSQDNPGIELPPLPSMGDLKLSGVLESRFFFA